MGWLEKLKDLFKIDINFSGFTLFRINITNKINSENKYQIDQPSKTIHIDLTKLTPDEEHQLKEIVQEAIKKDDYTLIENKASEIVEDFKAKDSAANSQNVLETLRNAISSLDFKILRAALYMRSKFQEGDRLDGNRVKLEIILKYGERGKDICNLCSAGYFEEWIIPLYEASKNSEIARNQFDSLYNIIIAESAFGVFINTAMTDEKVTSAIEEKIIRNSQYGIKYANVHGIGKNNIKKIQDSLKKLEEQYQFTIEINQKIGDILFVRLEFNLPLTKVTT